MIPVLAARRCLFIPIRVARQRCGPPLRSLRTLRPLHQNHPKDEIQESNHLQNESRTSQISRVLKEASTEGNNLLAPVHIPEDPHAILNERHPATSILSNSALVVTREMEMMNVMMGYEEANKYVIMDAQGNHLGFMAEQERGMGRMMARQILRTHRSFTTHIFDREMREILRFHRPFSYISSAIGVYDPLTPDTRSSAPSASLDLSPTSTVQNGQIVPQTSLIPVSEMRLIGETKQVWAPLRRKYDLYLSRPSEPGDPALVFEQFARVDEPFLSWDFALRGAGGNPLGTVSRNWTNFGRELFTDAGVYALRMDGVAEQTDGQEEGASSVLGSSPGMTLDQRAVMLATAVTIDYDYFSRERSGFFGGMPFFIPMGGGAGEAGAAGAAGAGAAGAAGEAGAAGVGTEVAGTAAGGVARGAAGGMAGYGEGAVTGAGTMAAYEAMQRAREGRATEDDASPMAGDYSPEDAPAQGQQEEVPWWEQDQAQQREQDPWGWGDGDKGGGGDGGDGGDWGDLF